MPEAIRKSLEILRTHRALAGREREGEGMEDTIRRVIGVFGRARANWVLVGAHAVGVLTEPRATRDFDFIVDGTRVDAVLAEIRREFPAVEILDLGPALRLREPDVDLIRSTGHALFREALEQARPEGDWKVPPPDIMIVLKFLSAISPWRQREARGRDMADLIRIYEAHRSSVDRAHMVRLASKAYAGAEREFEDLMRRIDGGEPISI